MKLKNLLILSMLLSFAVACDVEKTEQGESPELDIDVEAESGELPEYEVNWADVNVDTRTKTVTVPKLIVVQEEEEVEVPYLEVNMPDNQQNMTERTIMVEAEIRGEMSDLSIEGVYAMEDDLIVIASLQSTGENLNGQTVRVSDQLVLNVPEDLDIEKFIIGGRPTGEFNNQYKYYETMDQLQPELAQAQQIYSKKS